MHPEPLLKLSDILTIIALLVGPVLAVQAQKWVERVREAKNRREWVFIFAGEKISNSWHFVALLLKRK